MKSKKILLSVLTLFFAISLPLFFNNCVGPTPDSQSSSVSSSRTGGNINTFSQNPPPMDGNMGFQFLLKEYLGPRCGGCHYSAVYFGAPYFDVANPSKSYDLSKAGLTKSDMIMRITNNPFCRTCTLDTNGEVYQAIMYWLDHR